MSAYYETVDYRLEPKTRQWVTRFFPRRVSGTRPTFDLIDAATGEVIVKAGDKVNANDKAFGKSFPFLALPTSGSSTQARGTSKAGAGTAGASDTAATAPSGAVAAGAGGTGSGHRAHTRPRRPPGGPARAPARQGGHRRDVRDLGHRVP